MNNPEQSDVLKTLQIMFPKAISVPLIRVGGERDGAYLLPSDFQDVEACFSPGCCNTKRFEDELCESWGIKCHLCDLSSDADQFDTPLKLGMQTFRKKWLADEGNIDSISLDDWVSEEEPNAKNLILQMDIEGAEYEILLGVSDKCLSRFRILVIEFHGLEMINDRSVFESRIEPVFSRLNKHFVCVHAHPNNCCGVLALSHLDVAVPSILELTFWRRDRYCHDPREAAIPSFPHQLDISFNVPTKRPLFLGQAWSLKPRTRSEESRERMLEISLDYTENLVRDLTMELSITNERVRSLERRLDELHWPVAAYRKLKSLFKRRA